MATEYGIRYVWSNPKRDYWAGYSQKFTEDWTRDHNGYIAITREHDPE